MKKTKITLIRKPSFLVKTGKRMLILGLALMITASSFAQESETDGDPGGDLGEPDEVPFDGGISLLVAAGVAYGAKKAHEARKKQASYFDGNK